MKNRNKMVTKSGQKRTPAQQRGVDARLKGKITSSSNRSARSKASSRRPVSQGGAGVGSGRAKVTASSGGTGRGQGGPNRADAAPWKKLNESAKTSGKGPVKGAPGTTGAPTNAKPVSRSAAGKNASTRMKRVLQKSAATRTAAGRAAAGGAVAKAGAVGAAAAVGINAGKVADGTLKGKPQKRNYGPPAPKAKAKSTGYAKGSFNDAFKRARTADKKSFTWKGKKYAVKLAS
jgi:hypothetical protein